MISLVIYNISRVVEAGVAMEHGGSPILLSLWSYVMVGCLIKYIKYAFRILVTRFLIFTFIIFESMIIIRAPASFTIPLVG
jgi:hypothetical protein